MMLVDSEKSSSEEKELDKMSESESELAPKYTGGGGGGGRGVPLSRTNGEKEQTIEQMIKKVGWGLLKIYDIYEYMIYGGGLLKIYDYM